VMLTPVDMKQNKTVNAAPALNERDRMNHGKAIVSAASPLRDRQAIPQAQEQVTNEEDHQLMEVDILGAQEQGTNAEEQDYSLKSQWPAVTTRDSLEDLNHGSTADEFPRVNQMRVPRAHSSWLSTLVTTIQSICACFAFSRRSLLPLSPAAHPTDQVETSSERATPYDCGLTSAALALKEVLQWTSKAILLACQRAQRAFSRSAHAGYATQQDEGEDGHSPWC